MSTHSLLVSLVFVCCFLGCLGANVPDYIKICKRDQRTIDPCVRNSIEYLRPYLARGIPELNVPGIEPLFIPEIRQLRGELSQLRASAKNVKVSGGGNFTIKSLNVDLNKYIFKGRVRFPKLHLEGIYKLDGKLLVLPLKGQGNLIADAIKCDADVLIHAHPELRNGKEYLKFTKMDIDINVKDYQIRLEGLFNGDKTLGDVTNEAINQNRLDFFRAIKPYLEMQISELLLDTANKIATVSPLDVLLPVA